MVEVGDQINVLLVETDPAFSKLAASYLVESGFKVIVLMTAEEALSSSESESVRMDLLITNVVMPDSDGWTLSRQLLKQHPQMKVIYTSSEAHADLIQDRKLPIPIGLFLRKPYDQKELISKILQVATTE